MSGRAVGAKNRAALVEAARLAFHEQGIKGTTIANIAERAGLPVGNVYYYFKTKSAFAEAVVASYADELDAAFVSFPDDPREAILAYVRWSLRRPARLASTGCPRATLIGDLQRTGDAHADEASALIERELAFVSRHFETLRGEHAEGRALRLAESLVAQVHGAKVLARALTDADLPGRRAREIADWVRART